MVTSKVYNEIEYNNNAYIVWNLLASMFKLQGAVSLNEAFKHLNYFTLKDCKNTTDYITKLRILVNKLCGFSSKFMIDDNFFSYKLQSNLGFDHISYFKRYKQDHDPFNADQKPKYSLSLAM